MREFRLLCAAALALSIGVPAPAQAKPKIYIAFQWHMHQPIYWPYETVVQTEAAARWDFDVYTIHTDRTGPYTAWPVDAVQAGSSLAHFGAQVSFTGSLMENLDAMEAAGAGFAGWRSRWSQSRSLATTNGNSSLELTLIGYHHPLMPLVPGADRRLQIELHQHALEQRFGAPVRAPQGIFPPETAFAEHVIPDFAAAGVKWTLVDNIHFDRARPDYPYNSGSNLYPPNAADQRDTGGDVNWVQLTNLWAPTKVSAPWGYQPHWVEYVDPESGASSRIIAVPAARYEGNEDARGGFGAFLYDTVMSQYEQFNTDDAHPMIVVLHHDGDNYGGGTDSYYHSNFDAFVSWLQANPSRFECTTIQDYLDRFPPDQGDVVHVEPGSWSGADNGDPEFLKWNGDPDATTGYSPDRNSWGVIVAAANRVHTAEALSPHTGLDPILAAGGNETDKAWHYLLNGETSCYWYWDNSEGGKWDSHPTRAANMAVQHADLVIAGGGADTVPPEIYLPQREPYNPGAIEWGTTLMPSDFDVWTYVYDVSGLADVTLHYRATPKGTVDASHMQYGAGTWTDLAMQGKSIAPTTDPQPTYKADEYRATIAGATDSLVDYYVSSTDTQGNLARSPILHVYVGTATVTPPPGGSVGWSPSAPSPTDVVTIWGNKPGKLHWGIDGWLLPPSSLEPTGTVAYDAKSVETPLAGPDALGHYSVQIGPTGASVTAIDFVMHWSDGSWDNNGGGDYHVAIGDHPAGADAGAPPSVADAGAPIQPGADASSLPPSGQDAADIVSGADAAQIVNGADASAIVQPGADASASSHPSTDAGLFLEPQADAGAVQQQPSVDAGNVRHDPPTFETQGCGCSSTGDAAQGWALLALSLLGLSLPLRRPSARRAIRE